MNPFRPPVKRTRHGFAIRLGDDETQLVLRLLGELRALLAEGDPASSALTGRLFPVANPDDDEMEAEYQRLMRDELVTSRLSAIATVEDILADGRTVDEAELTAFMQSVNAVRLVLGTMLGVTDDIEPDDGDGEVPDDMEDTPEYHLYGYLSWLLEHIVKSLSGA